MECSFALLAGDGLVVRSGDLIDQDLAYISVSNSSTELCRVGCFVAAQGSTGLFARGLHSDMPYGCHCTKVYNLVMACDPEGAAGRGGLSSLRQ